MTSTFLNLREINFPEIVDNLTAIIFSPMIIHLAALVRQPLVQNTIKESIAVSEKVQASAIDVIQAWERTLGESNIDLIKQQREKFRLIAAQSYQDYLNDGKSEIVKDLLNVLSDINKDVGTMTNGIVDLRLIAPLGLGILTIRQLMKQGWLLDDIPWYILAWFTFDVFIKLNTQEESHLAKLPTNGFLGEL
jgi:hypothetical protein